MNEEIEIIYAGSSLTKPLGYAFKGPYKGWLLVKGPDELWMQIAPIEELIQRHSRRASLNLSESKRKLNFKIWLNIELSKRDMRKKDLIIAMHERGCKETYGTLLNQFNGTYSINDENEQLIIKILEVTAIV